MKYFLKYSFTILLMLSCLIALPIGLKNNIMAQAKASAGLPEDTQTVSSESSADTAESFENTAVGTASSESVVPADDGADAAVETMTQAAGETQTSDPAGETAGSNAASGKTDHPADRQTDTAEDHPADKAEDNITDTAPDTAADTPKDTAAAGAEYAFTDVTEDYFDDALFIGDSRTVGISEYGGLGNATFFASVGMSVYTVFKEKVSVAGFGDTSLSNLLKSRTYGKIYIMLGINELGCDYTQTVSKYSEVVDKIREYEPDALLFIEANLHVSAAKSGSDSIFNNKNINRFNESISELADGSTSFYLDVNPIFDDENGNLSAGYTGDSIHIYGKYYASWGKWFLSKGIVK